MCLTCGCALPHENHGNADYLTIEDLERSARVDGKGLDEAVQILVRTADVAKREPNHRHR